MGGSQLGSVQLQMFTGICAPKASREPITLSSLVCANCSQQQPQQLQQQQQPQCFRHYNSTIRSLLALSEWINQFFLLFFAFALFSGGLFSLITFTLTRKLPQQAARGASGADFQINRYTNMFNHTHISKHAVCTFFLLLFVVHDCFCFLSLSRTACVVFPGWGVRTLRVLVSGLATEHCMQPLTFTLRGGDTHSRLHVTFWESCGSCVPTDSHQYHCKTVVLAVTIQVWVFNSFHRL